MPFVSKAQERWAFATHQPFAKNWAAMTEGSNIPERVGKKKHRVKRKRRY